MFAATGGYRTVPTEFPWQDPALALVIGYLLGSIPFGLLLTRAAGAGDLRQIGSGNIGATNVLRTGRKGLAAATLILDALKGFAAVWIAERYFGGTGVMAAAAAFLGHLYPVWLRFRGGKGVATMLGIVLALHWPIGLIYAVVWLGLLAVFRISSLAGMTAAVGAPLSAAFFAQFDLVLPLMALALLVVWKHRENIERLLSGAEPRVGKRGRNGASRADA
ncbi:glycerol-3-phosphate 1-O-acyltransferase PlsY [Sphingomonas psychrolutea]|uniref:glycerol-3-phosphate 1-O-acyltransferase PlsY n=1 Tax=Sphingomonas psychrolutea TaxID=1259676 RepID=UPI00166CC589